MANAYINVYKGNPTADALDGTIVSTGGANTDPIEFNLDASQNESKKAKLAVRTESGYVASDVVISDNNDTDDRLKLCLTENGTYADSITVGNVSSVNTIFWAQASSSSLESPQVDTSANFVIRCMITVAE